MPGAVVSTVPLDLSDLSSVRECATRLLDQEPFDVVLNNAGKETEGVGGVGRGGKGRVTEGLEGKRGDGEVKRSVLLACQIRSYLTWC